MEQNRTLTLAPTFINQPILGLVQGSCGTVEKKHTRLDILLICWMFLSKPYQASVSFSAKGEVTDLSGSL